MLVFRDERDRAVYRKAMFAAAEKSGCSIHAYVLMSNHVHLLLTPARADAPGRMMRRLGAAYVRRFNDRYGRTGTLWEGRFRSTVIDSELYFFECSRYVELNPVRAGITNDPASFAWSSYQHNALGRVEPGLAPHALYLRLGATASERRLAYRALFAQSLDAGAVHSFRNELFAGGDDFRLKLSHALERPLTSLNHGGDRRSGRFHAHSATLGHTNRA